MVSESQKRATTKYNKENYEFIKITLHKGEKDIIINKAEKEGKTISQYIRDMIIGEEEK